MQLHQLQRTTKAKREKRVGRGGRRGKTSGRGTKGQKARAGHRIFPQVREKIKKLPKLRGYNFKSIQDNAAVVNVGVLEKYFSAGDTVTPQLLVARGLVRSPRNIKLVVKILADGDLSKKFTVSGCKVSAAARGKIEAAGGSIS